MSNQEFPMNSYLSSLVRLLDIIKYQDTNYTHNERVQNLKKAYSVAANHFAQPKQQEILKVSPKRLDAALRTITAMVVYCWVKVSPELMAALTIHYTYTLLLDDSTNHPHLEMATFFEDMVLGKQQKHPWWQLVNEFLPNVLQHYGGFCAFNIIRSIFDFFQGCWIEQYNFQGFPGSHQYPLFLRRLNGLGHCVGASLFPKECFDEQALFIEITTAIAQMEPLMVFVNDMMSFYKEFDDMHDQTSLVKNYCQVEGLSIEQGLDRLTCDSIQCCEQILAIFDGKDPIMFDTIKSFVHGYVTWHLSDKRYRLSEVYEACTGEDGAIASKFRCYYEQARSVGNVDEAKWDVPSVSAIAERLRAREVKVNGRAWSEVVVQ